MNKDKNYLIEFYRGIIALLVIHNHLWPEQNALYYLIWGCTGTTMALFFMISGYFLYTENRQKMEGRLRKRIRRQFALTAEALAFYYLIKLIPMAVSGRLPEYAEKYLAPQVLLRLVFPNSTLICGPMWFMVSLLYTMILIYVLLRLDLLDKATCLIPLLLLICLGLSGEFGSLLPRVETEYARFFLIHGFPLVMTGYLIHKHEQVLLEKAGPFIRLPLLAVLSLAVTMVSARVGINPITFFAIPFGAALLVFALLHPEWGRKSPVAEIGTKDSLHIYLMHWCFTSPAVSLMQRLHLTHWIMPYLAAPVIWLFCVLLSRIYIRVFRERQSLLPGKNNAKE
ncbi:MAG: acyltransferase [Lachnospiraceae bacterium]|nr:acyltransferase [Lachnospiraceae bacterium]